MHFFESKTKNFYFLNLNDLTNQLEPE